MPTHTRLFSALSLLVTVSLLGACITADPIDDNLPPTAAAAFTLDNTRTFASTNAGVTVAYTVEHPAGWQVTPDTENGVLVISRDPLPTDITRPQADNVTMQILAPVQDNRDLEAYAAATLNAADDVAFEGRRLDGKRAVRLVQRLREGNTEVEQVSYVIELAPTTYLTLHAYAQRNSADNLLLAADAVLRSFTVLSLNFAEGG